MRLLRTFSGCRAAGRRNRLSKLFYSVEDLPPRKYVLFAQCLIGFQVPRLKVPACDDIRSIGFENKYSDDFRIDGPTPLLAAFAFSSFCLAVIRS
jgi:hypothetical protein